MASVDTIDLVDTCLHPLSVVRPVGCMYSSNPVQYLYISCYTVKIGPVM
jgi:hypothetical protein